MFAVEKINENYFIEAWIKYHRTAEKKVLNFGVAREEFLQNVNFNWILKDKSRKHKSRRIDKKGESN